MCSIVNCYELEQIETFKFGQQRRRRRDRTGAADSHVSERFEARGVARGMALAKNAFVGPREMPMYLPPETFTHKLHNSELSLASHTLIVCVDYD